MRTQELADAVAALEETTSLPTVALVECSLWQCESHAAELTARWRLDVVPWPLGQEGEPQADTVVATYFHYNDVRRRWPHLLDRVRFLTLRVEPGLEQWLSPTDAVHVVEWDAPTAEAVAADLRAVLGPDRRIEEVVTTSPDSVLSELGDARVLFSPRAWSELGESARRDPRCRVVRYVFDDSELLTLARDLGWQPVRDRQGALR